MAETKAQKRERERIEYENQQASLQKCNAIGRKENEAEWARNHAVINAAQAAVARALGGAGVQTAKPPQVEKK